MKMELEFVILKVVIKNITLKDIVMDIIHILKEEMLLLAQE